MIFKQARHIFGSPCRDPRAKKMWDAVSGRDLCPCAKFQPNPFSSFEGNASQTYRQTNRQTDKQTDK